MRPGLRRWPGGDQHSRPTYVETICYKRRSARTRHVGLLTTALHLIKCDILSITRKKQPINHIYPYQLHGHHLKHCDSVNISKDMCWTKHIDTITSKANSKLGFIKRNININNRTVKDHAYKSLVRPILEYSQSVWDP